MYLIRYFPIAEIDPYHSYEEKLSFTKPMFICGIVITALSIFHRKFYGDQPSISCINPLKNSAYVNKREFAYY